MLHGLADPPPTPASDLSQQRSMLAGEAQPAQPGRHDPAADGPSRQHQRPCRRQLINPSRQPAAPDAVGGMGQSWGADDMLQLAGAQSPATPQSFKRCPGPAQSVAQILKLGCSDAASSNRGRAEGALIHAFKGRDDRLSPVTSLC